jgi:hypothetical protein
LTTVSAGTLKLGAAGGATNTPLGTTGAGTTVSSGAALDLNGYSLGTAEALTLNGTGGRDFYEPDTVAIDGFVPGYSGPAGIDRQNESTILGLNPAFQRLPSHPAVHPIPDAASLKVSPDQPCVLQSE